MTKLSDIPGDQLTLIDCPISFEDKIACLKREIAYRERVYGNLVATGKMRAEAAYREVAIMCAILEDYRNEYPALGRDRGDQGR